jgi:hypothetical protein
MEISQIPQSRRRIFGLIAFGLAFLVAGMLVEGIFTVLERIGQSGSFREGDGGRWARDSRWGWKATPGTFRKVTPEFDVTGNINRLFMNDYPFDADADRSKIRVMVLGDSHTFATGASMEDTWPKVLERGLNLKYGAGSFRIYNASTIGYSLHQYLLRLIDQGELLRPHYVVVGLTYVSDLYDLLPPDHGGWLFDDGAARDYFDLDDSGELVEKHWDPSTRDGEVDSDRKPPSIARRIRGFGSHFATFRYLLRSKLFLFIGTHIRIGEESLWPNMEVVLEREVSPRHEYQWRLARALLLRIRDESRRLGAELIVVGIPYLPQVYDEVWEATFGGNPAYSRVAAIERVTAWCASNGITYVDTLDGYRESTKRLGRWLHHRKDAHPTAEGHQVIAETVLDAGIIQPPFPSIPATTITLSVMANAHRIASAHDET